MWHALVAISECSFVWQLCHVSRLRIFVTQIIRSAIGGTLYRLVYCISVSD